MCDCAISLSPGSFPSNMKDNGGVISSLGISLTPTTDSANPYVWTFMSQGFLQRKKSVLQIDLSNVTACVNMIHFQGTINGYVVYDHEERIRDASQTISYQYDEESQLLELIISNPISESTKKRTHYAFTLSIQG